MLNKAPVFILPNAENKLIKLSEYLGKIVVIYFYPKDNTPGCTKQACEFSSLLPEFTKLNTKIIGISKDSTQSHQNFINKNNLAIELLSDADTTVMQQYGVWKEKQNFGKTYLGVVRSTFIIDTTGVIAKKWSNVKVADHATKVLNFITKNY